MRPEYHLHAQGELLEIFESVSDALRVVAYMMDNPADEFYGMSGNHWLDGTITLTMDLDGSTVTLMNATFPWSF